MEKSEIVVVPKESVRKISYLGTPIMLALGGLLIWDSSLYRQAIEITMLIFGSIAVILGILWLPHIYRFKINFGPDAIYKYGLFTKQIPYKNIKKLVVGKGFIEIRGSSIFHTISIGDLYTNFEGATKMLASKIQHGQKPDIDGNEKYIAQYFDLSTPS